uniref:DRBM domain-containing protein n=1 Tax=Timema genevievae TaxID=629358 RepID=A0A7R9JT36_TIMGE|nr:unnamed protein product [Timema genevievae]
MCSSLDVSNFWAGDKLAILMCSSLDAGDKLAILMCSSLDVSNFWAGDKLAILMCSSLDERRGIKTCPLNLLLIPGSLGTLFGPLDKVNKRVKRRRQNARLRKILQPKNAIMVLNELVSGVKFSFQEHSTALKQTTFIFNAEVNGKMYAGQGLSKLVAKQNAAESALKALLLEKIAQASEASTKMETNELEGGGAPVEEKKNPPAPGTDNGDTASECEEGSIAEGKPGAPEDEVPWGNLASFALYKLFVEWQQQGTPVPLTKPITQAVTLGPKSNPPAPMKKIPENPTERHPVMLLNQLRPGVVFNELSRVGTPPDVTFTLEVTVDGTSYTGSGKNKKDAKKEAAKAALSGALSINYSTP